MQFIDPLIPYKLMNKLYFTNFDMYKKLYFIYKRYAERHEIAFINKVLKPGMQVLDIGANIGFYTLLFSRLVTNKGRVDSFEPEVTNFTNLSKLCKGVKNIKLNNLAVGEKNGIISLFISNDLNVDHLTYSGSEDHKDRTAVKVKSTTIDSYLGNKKVDFIKIDTQGFEYKVLSGMLKTLKKSSKLMILSEFSPYDLKSAGSSPEDFKNLLYKAGYKISYLHPNKRLYSKKASRMSYTNIIATKGY